MGVSAWRQRLVEYMSKSVERDWPSGEIEAHWKSAVRVRGQQNSVVPEYTARSRRGHALSRSGHGIGMRGVHGVRSVQQWA